MPLAKTHNPTELDSFHVDHTKKRTDFLIMVKFGANFFHCGKN